MEYGCKTKCDSCKAGPCRHNNKQRALIIKRENFRLNVSEELKEQIKSKAQQINQEGDLK
jgi:uncharacterized protein YuzB (UPF0349 family)